MLRLWRICIVRLKGAAIRGHISKIVIMGVEMIKSLEVEVFRVDNHSTSLVIINVSLLGLFKKYF